jgi:hypothetical protein
MLHVPLSYFRDTPPFRIETNSHALHRCPISWTVAAATGASVLHYRYADTAIQVVVHWLCCAPDEPVSTAGLALEPPIVDFDRHCASRIVIRPHPILTSERGCAVAPDLALMEMDDAVMRHHLWRHAARNAALFEQRLGPTIDEL